MKTKFTKVTIVGVGLMGGSLGMALKKQCLVKEVMGWGRKAGRLKAARELGAVDSWTLSQEETLKNSELLIFATPISVTP